MAEVIDAVPVLPEIEALRAQRPGVFGKAIRRGGYGAVSSLARAAEAGAAGLGLDGIKSAADALADEYEAKSQAPRLAPRVRSLADANSVGDYVELAAGALGENLPQALTQLALGIAASRVKPVTAVLGRAGAATAAVAPTSFALNLGEIYGEQKEQGVDAPGGAVLPAAAAAALDLVGPGALFGSIFKGAGRDATAGGAAELTKRILKGTLLGAAAEAPTEFVQERIAIGAREAYQPGYAGTEEATDRALTAAFGGGVVGGVFGAGAGVLRRGGRQVEQQSLPAESRQPETAPTTFGEIGGQPLPSIPAESAPVAAEVGPIVDPVTGRAVAATSAYSAPYVDPEVSGGVLTPDSAAIDELERIRDQRRSDEGTAAAAGLDIDGLRARTLAEGLASPAVALPDPAPAPAPVPDDTRFAELLSDVRGVSLPAEPVLTESAPLGDPGTLKSSVEARETRELSSGSFVNESAVERLAAAAQGFDAPAVSPAAGGAARIATEAVRGIQADVSAREADAAVRAANAGRVAASPPPREFSGLRSPWEGAKLVGDRRAARENPMEFARSKIEASLGRELSALQSAGAMTAARATVVTRRVRAALSAQPDTADVRAAVRDAVRGGLSSLGQDADVVAEIVADDISRQSGGAIRSGEVSIEDLTDEAGQITVAVGESAAVPAAERAAYQKEGVGFSVGVATKEAQPGKASYVHVSPERVYDATRYSTDPLYREAKRSAGGDVPVTLARYQRAVAQAGYEAMLLPHGEVRLFSAPEGVTVQDSDFRRVAARASGTHRVYGFSATSIASGADHVGAPGYAVLSYPERTLSSDNDPSGDLLDAYARTNADLLTRADTLMITRTVDGKTVLDVASVTDDVRAAMKAARALGQASVVDTRTGAEVAVGHPAFDSAAEYARAAGRPAPQAVSYQVPDQKLLDRLARFYRRKPAPQTEAARASYAALAEEVEAQFAALSAGVTVERGGPYESAAAAAADLSTNKHLFVPDPPPHPYLSPEQAWQLRAVVDGFGFARVGFDRSAAGAVNAARLHAQMVSDAALPAYMTEVLAPADRRNTEVLPEDLWRPAVQASLDLYSRAMYRHERIMSDKGAEIFRELDRILGGRQDVEIYTYEADRSRPYVGKYRKQAVKDLIAVAVNSESPSSVAAHEAFHFLEERVLSVAEKKILARAFSKGTVDYARLIEAARAIDTRNRDVSAETGFSVVEEIESNPAEARAYAFEAYRRGDLSATGAVQKVFDILRRALERAANFVRGLGFRSAVDVMEAIDRGDYALRNRAKLNAVGDPDAEWFSDVEEDILPGAELAYHKGKAARPRGRPHWIKSGGDVQKLRARLRSLARDGAPGKDWHYRSSAAIMSWARGNRPAAELLAKLIATYSPRTPVGQDLIKALVTVAQHQRGLEIAPGAPGAHIKSAKDILAGKGDVTGEKRSNFFRNLMRKIAPDEFGAGVQGATVDMWVAHAFGFANDTSGSITSSEYNYANAEIQRLAREFGWEVEEAQAAIWIAIKGRMNATRAYAADDAVRRGWTVRVEKKLSEGEKEIIRRQGTLFGSEISTKSKFSNVLKKEHERDHVMNWLSIALSQQFSPGMFANGNYSYYEAFRDIATGKLKPSRAGATVGIGIVEADIMADPDDTRDTLSGPPVLELFSKAAYIEQAKYIRDGNFSRAAVMEDVGALIKRAEVPHENVSSVFGRLGLGASSTIDAVRRGATAFLSGEQLARNSEAYRNGHRALTVFDQRKKRLISQATESALASWKDAPLARMNTVSKALLDRTIGGYRVGSIEYDGIIGKLTSEERKMFEDATRMIADMLRTEYNADRMTFARLLNASGPEIFDQWSRLGENDKRAFEASVSDGDRAYIRWASARGEQVQRLVDEGYFPERRYGDHAVTAYYKHPETGRRIAVLHEQYETRAAAKSRVDGLKGVPGLKDVLSSIPGIEVEYAFQYKPDISGTMSFQRFVEVAGDIGIALSQAERERVARALIAADSVKNNRIFRRENVPGASEQGLRILSEMAVATASKVAYAELSPAVQAARKGQAVDARFNPDGTVSISIDPETDLWDSGGERAGFYRRKLDEKVNFVLSPRDSNISSTLRAMASLQFLGGSVAAAAVQLTSLPMNAAPYLSQYAGITDSSTRLMSAATWSAANAGLLADIRRLDDRTLSVPYLDNVRGLRDAVITAAQDGTIIDTEIYEIMGLTRGQVGALPSFTRRAAEKWMGMFRWSERVNRAATFIATYKIGLEKNLAGRELYDFAQKAVYDTQFRYDEVNRPGIAQSPVGALLMTFKTYPIYMTELLVNLAKTDKRAAAFMMLAIFLFAGAEGLPFAEDALDVVDGVSQKVFGSPFSARRALRNTMKDASEVMLGADYSAMFMQGAANWMTGASIASRVGMGNLIPGTRAFTADADFKKVAEEILGPAFSAVTAWGAPADALVKGDFEAALRKAPFLAVQNATKGWNAYWRGYAEDQGGRKIVDLSGAEAFLQGVGFTSAAAARAYDLDRVDREQRAFYTQVKRDIITKIVKATSAGDSNAVQEAMDFVGRWNERNPEMPLSMSATNIRRAIALAGVPLNERTLKSLPRALRGQSVAAELLAESQP